jgi:hypothetical protein
VFGEIGQVGVRVVAVVVLDFKFGKLFSLTFLSILNNLFRTRSCNVTEGGEQCPGSPLEAQECNTTIACPS